MGIFLNRYVEKSGLSWRCSFLEFLLHFISEFWRIFISVDFVPMHKEITTDYEPGFVHEVTMHDGSTIHLYKMSEELDPFDRKSAIINMEEHREAGDILTGLIYMDRDSRDLHDVLETSHLPLNRLAEDDLCPGSHLLKNINASLR